MWGIRSSRRGPSGIAHSLVRAATRTLLVCLLVFPRWSARVLDPAMDALENRARRTAACPSQLNGQAIPKLRQQPSIRADRMDGWVARTADRRRFSGGQAMRQAREVRFGYMAALTRLALAEVGLDAVVQRILVGRETLQAGLTHEGIQVHAAVLQPVGPSIIHGYLPVLDDGVAVLVGPNRE